MLLRYKADPNAHKYGSNTALMEAAYNGHIDVVEMLLEHGARIETESDHRDGVTALVQAVWGQNAAIVELLLEHGANPNVVGDDTPVLMKAVQQGNLRIADALLESGANASEIDESDFNQAEPSYLRMVRLVQRYRPAKQEPRNTVSKDVTVRPPHPFLLLMRRLRNPAGTLHFQPITADQVEQAILDCPDCIHLKDNDGTTCLHYAVIAGRVDVARLLLAAGADIQAADELGNNALHHLRKQSAEMVVLLKAHDLSCETGNNEGLTPLHRTCRSYREEAVEALLQAGASVVSQANDGSTPLHYAAINNASEAAKLLCLHGATIDARDNTGKTPLHWAACRRGQYTPDERLTLAIMGKAPEVAEVLLAATPSPDVNACDARGCTPLFYAARPEIEDVFDLLRSYGAVLKRSSSK